MMSIIRNEAGVEKMISPRKWNVGLKEVYKKRNKIWFHVLYRILFEFPYKKFLFVVEVFESDGLWNLGDNNLK